MRPQQIALLLALICVSGLARGAQETVTGFHLKTCGASERCFDVSAPLAKRGYIGTFYILEGPLTVLTSDKNKKTTALHAEEALYSIASNTLMLKSAHEDVMIELHSGKLAHFRH